MRNYQAKLRSQGKSGGINLSLRSVSALTAQPHRTRETRKSPGSSKGEGSNLSPSTVG